MQDTEFDYNSDSLIFLHIRNIRELQTLKTPAHTQASIFFNVFSGLQWVAKSEDHHFGIS